MVVVDNKCDCSSAPPVTMDPIEIMYILSRWDTRFTFLKASFYPLMSSLTWMSFWLWECFFITSLEVIFFLSCTTWVFSFTSSLMPCVCMFWTYKHVLMLYLHPWRLWTQRVTKMWQTEVSEGQKEARIMSSLPPWGMTMCSCESTWTLLEHRNKQCFMAKRLHWFSGNFMVTVKLELVIAPGQEIEQHKICFYSKTFVRII